MSGRSRNPSRARGGAKDCVLSLGSNLGNRLDHLRRALLELRRLPRTRILKVSSIYASSPVGVGGQSSYLNCCAHIRTGMSPMGLLAELKRMEALHGRRPGRRWAPRPLDLDILFFGRLRLSTPWLTLPHPRASLRRFVLLPLSEIHPRRLPPGSPGRGALDRRLHLNAPFQNVSVYRRAVPFRKGTVPGIVR